MSILLVDDEVELTQPLSLALIREGYDVDVATDGESGYQKAINGSYDLLILDWMLPYKSGLSIAVSLRAKSDTTPILFLTAKDTLDDRVRGLDAGADDYIIKPFELRELLARVRALLRRSPHNLSVNTTRLQAFDLELDLENQLAYRLGRTIELSERETRLLEYFIINKGQVITHEQIYQYLWTDQSQPSSNVIAALIRLLRRKIDLKPESPLIHTIYGKGYRLGIIS